MLSTPTTELLHHLKSGDLFQSDTEMLDEISAAQLVDELRSVYRVTFQERRLGRKWEISLAGSFRAELALRQPPHAIFASVRLIPAYLNCLMLNTEGDSVTGISRLARLTVWPVRKPAGELALKSGKGFKLDKTPDGWAIKPIQRRIVKLSEEFLRERGWQFDHMKQFMPVS